MIRLGSRNTDHSEQSIFTKCLITAKDYSKCFNAYNSLRQGAVITLILQRKARRCKKIESDSLAWSLHLHYCGHGLGWPLGLLLPGHHQRKEQKVPDSKT